MGSGKLYRLMRWREARVSLLISTNQTLYLFGRTRKETVIAGKDPAGCAGYRRMAKNRVFALTANPRAGACGRRLDLRAGAQRLGFVRSSADCACAGTSAHRRG